MRIGGVEDYFARGCGRCERFDTADCSTRQWEPGLRALRDLCLEAGLTETLKWAHPCYVGGGRNVAIIGAFRRDFRLSFFNPALMTDPEGVLERQGPNTAHADMIRLTANDQVAERAGIIRAYLAEALDYARRGVVPAKVAVELELPEELIEALDADPELAEAFHALTPGRQRGYVIGLKGAKKAETRVKRIEKWRGRILAGLGRGET